MKKLLSMMIAVFVVFFAVIGTNADTISELEQEQKRLEQEAKEYEEMMAQKESEIADQEEYIAALTAKITNINSQIALSREKIAEFEKQISLKEDEKKSLMDDAQKSIDTLSKRLCAIYKAGDASSLEIILGAGSFSDFVDKIQLVESIAESDQKLIDSIEAQIASVNATMEELAADKVLMEEEKANLQAKQDELNLLLEENQEALATLYGEKADVEQLITENEDHRYEIDAEIEAYYEEQRRLEEERLEKERLEQMQQQQQQQQGGNSTTTPSIPDNPQYSGNYVWPVPGIYNLTSVFYEERTNYYHGGIDIADSGFMGTSIIAAADGVVIDANNSCTHNWGKYGSCGCGGGFGNYVWLDHGDGKATIYAHLSYHTVSIGQTVSAGELLGYGGSTGYSTGPHLHFECRYYGSRYDPMSEYNQ